MATTENTQEEHKVNEMDNNNKKDEEIPEEPELNSITKTTDSESSETATTEEYGYDLYPERKGGRYIPSWKNIVLGDGRQASERQKCESRVWEMANTNPMVKLMIAALDSAGCGIQLDRHVVCERCDRTVTGGYDIQTNQIVVCQNMCTNSGLVAGVLTHEMIHMFDYCRHKLDFENIQHLACTEIRAANLTHCSFMSAMSQGDSSPIRISERHQDCVRTKAAYSVEAVRHVGIDEARRIVESVFPQCYADMEPIGRRVRRNSLDAVLAFKERHHYGY